ncbi:transposable element Tcb1 transposase [Trichonephila clavipes]|nr:transposable element Tcb1 transposase [Trichonephila clavipes]
MAQRKHLEDFLRCKIIGRLECGHTQPEVSEEHGITQSVISRLWQRFQDDGNSVRMTGHIYRDVNLEKYVRLFRGAMGAEFLFMDDNARPHRANVIDECLQSEDITRMDWPAYSPDLNPIEHMWDMLGQRIAARQPPPTCLPEFRRSLLDEWCNIPQDQIDNLILSMPRRCKACIASSGRHTPYLPSY